MTPWRAVRRTLRRRVSIGTVLAAVLILMAGAHHIADRQAPATGDTVARVVDGDGAVLTDGRTIRYDTVDTPEYRSAPGRASAECVNPELAALAEERNRQLVEGQAVTVLDTGRRSWDRVIADLVLADGTNVSEVLIAEGLGVRFDPDATNACPGGA